MPRPSPDRVIHDWTFAILPVAAGFILIILTVIALVYSIGVKTAIPEGLAIAFAGLSYGLFGLWMGGHLVRYCRGHYTRGGVAEAVSPPPLPLTGIATGADGTAMAAGASIVLPITYQQPQQQSRQDQQDHRQQQRQYTQQHQLRQNQEQLYQQQLQQRPSQQPHVQSLPSPHGQFRQQPQPQREQQRQQQGYCPQRDQQPPAPHQNARSPHYPRNTLLEQVPTVLQPGPKQRQPSSDPNSRAEQQTSPTRRTSSVQMTPVEAYSRSIDVPRPLHRENRQVSRESRAPGALSNNVAGPHSQGNQSRVTQHRGDVEQDPRRASMRSTSLDSGTRQSLQVRTSQLPVVKPFGSGWANPGQPASPEVAPLRIQKGEYQSPVPGLDEPYPIAYAPSGQHMQMNRQAGQVRPNLHGPRPQPQSDHRANGPQRIRMVSESPPGNDIAATQTEQVEHVSRNIANANPVMSFVLLPTYIFTHGQVVDPERSNPRIFGVLFEDADDEKPSCPVSGLRYKHDSGIIVESLNDGNRRSTPSSRWGSWSSRSETASRSGRSE
ncbi:hypothetical protein LX36DRAFT_466787 [Colletotrichum falcatum]|nr:hypothetical protein LX36DRAFT_466787 [Colletotrichum falcatum]